MSTARTMLQGLCIATAAIALTTGTALDAAAAESNFYVGVAAGQSIAHVDRHPQELPGNFLSIPPGLGFRFNATDLDRTDTALAGLVGYRVNSYLAIEAQYLDLGESEYTAGIVGATPTLILRPPTAGTLPAPPFNFFVPGPGSIFPILGVSYVVAVPANLVVRTSTRGPAISARGTWPVAERFEIYGRAGLYVADTTSTVSLGSFRTDTTDRSEEALLGIGAQWHATDHWSVRLDWQRLIAVGSRPQTGVADVDMITLGALFRI